MVSFYTTLNNLKEKNNCLNADRLNSAISTELVNNGKVLIVHRTSIETPGSEVLFYLNLSNEKQTVSGPIDSKSQWMNVFTQRCFKKANKPFQLAPWAYVVLEK